MSSKCRKCFNYFGKQLNDVCKRVGITCKPALPLIAVSPTKCVLCSPKDTPRKSHRGTVRYSPKLETTPCQSIVKWIHALWYMYIEYHTSLRQHNNMNESHNKNPHKGSQTHTQSIQCMIPIIKISKRCKNRSIAFKSRNTGERQKSEEDSGRSAGCGIASSSGY